MIRVIFLSFDSSKWPLKPFVHLHRAFLSLAEHLFSHGDNSQGRQMLSAVKGTRSLSRGSVVIVPHPVPCRTDDRTSARNLFRRDATRSTIHYSTPPISHPQFNPGLQHHPTPPQIIIWNIFILTHTQADMCGRALLLCNISINSTTCFFFLPSRIFSRAALMPGRTWFIFVRVVGTPTHPSICFVEFNHFGDPKNNFICYLFPLEKWLPRNRKCSSFGQFPACDLITYFMMSVGIECKVSKTLRSKPLSHETWEAKIWLFLSEALYFLATLN